MPQQVSQQQCSHAWQWFQNEERLVRILEAATCLDEFRSLLDAAGVTHLPDPARTPLSKELTRYVWHTFIY